MGSTSTNICGNDDYRKYMKTNKNEIAKLIAINKTKQLLEGDNKNIQD